MLTHRAMQCYVVDRSMALVGKLNRYKEIPRVRVMPLDFNARNGYL